MYYQIENTKNLHKEQSSGAYKDPEFWPTFHEDMKKFKEDVIDAVNNKKPYILIRIGHSEFSLFNYIVPGQRKVGNLKGRHSNNKQTPQEYQYYYESILASDHVTTQIGYDFKEWINVVINYLNIYKKHKAENSIDTLLNNPVLFKENPEKLPINKLITMPLDIIYGLCANKWFLKTFKNRIGLIGNYKKLKVIKELMKHKEYRDYVENDHFTDYIAIPQNAALNSPDLEKNLEEAIKKSTCDIFLCGMGVSKLRVFYKFKEIRNCVYMDVGCGICALAGMVDIRRPYMGAWKNYRLKDYDYKGIDQIDWNYGLKGSRAKLKNNQVFLD